MTKNIYSQQIYCLKENIQAMEIITHLYKESPTDNKWENKHFCLLLLLSRPNYSKTLRWTEESGSVLKISDE
jgi:hypothetical protein